jgi:hypothetical protein
LRYPALTVDARDVHHEVNSERDRFTHAAVWQAHIGGEDAVRETCQRLVGGIRMDGREASQVPGVERLKQIKGLCAADLANDDAIGPMPQRGAHQVGNRDRRQGRLLPERLLGATRFKAQEVWLLQMNLVFPVPVPPEMRTFWWLAMASLSWPAREGVSAPTSTSSSRL